MNAERIGECRICGFAYPLKRSEAAGRPYVLPLHFYKGRDPFRCHGSLSRNFRSVDLRDVTP